MGAIEDLAPLIVGQDPRRTEYLWQSMYRAPFFREGAVGMSAVSGIDQALHDIRAKDLGVPLYELLGGRVRDRVRFYDHLAGGDALLYDPRNVEHFGDLAAKSVADGFTAIKILAGPPTAPLDSMAAVRDVVERIERTRAAVGDDVDIMLDFHGRAWPAMAITYGLAVAPYRPWFIEEPVPPDNVDAMVEVARALPIPIATGERLTTRHGFRQLFEKRAIAIAQPDVCHAGGVTELLKIASMADAYNIALAPHNPLGPIATMVNLHLGFAIPNFLIQEVMRTDVAWRDDVVDAPVRFEGGYADPPTRAGIGVELADDAAAKHPFVRDDIIRVFHADGSVADW
jgi:galactonate dehydratase